MKASFGVIFTDGVYHNSLLGSIFLYLRSMITTRNFCLHCASQCAMNSMHCVTIIRFALVLGKIHMVSFFFILDDKFHFCGICMVMLKPSREVYKWECHDNHSPHKKLLKCNVLPVPMFFQLKNLPFLSKYALQ